MAVDELRRLAEVAPRLERSLTSTEIEIPALCQAQEVRRETVRVVMRDGVHLATDLYLPPTLPAPAVVMRTPYGRRTPRFVDVFMAWAQRGYAVIAQDCRGTGDSEPEHWDYYVYEPEDGWDCVEWVGRQDWFGGFLGACGSSYVAQTQWCMAMHPRMSTIVPEVSGLGVAPRTAHKYMFYHAYARSVGKGAGKLTLGYAELERQMIQETLAGGYFNEPLERPLPEVWLAGDPQLRALEPAAARRRLWERYGALSCARRAEFIKQALGVEEITLLEIEALAAMLGAVPHDAFTLPRPQRAQVCRSLQAPALMITGWYDWSLNDALATWALLKREAPDAVRSASRLIITPSAHNTPGFHEGAQDHPELRHAHRVPEHVDLLLRWYGAVREGALAQWPEVIYYLTGANQWYAASAWPPPQARAAQLYLAAGGVLAPQPPGPDCAPDRYTYHPDDPTPTVGGSIVSYVYRPGSCDVAGVQRRADVLTYTSAVLEGDLDVVGALQVVLYANSSAVDTDFAARLSDVCSDGRVIQLQSGMLRARYRNPERPEWLEPGRVYRLEIDLWATAHRFRAGHRLRLDLSSADFPRFDRHTHRGGEPLPPTPAEQTIYHDSSRPSHLLLPVLATPRWSGRRAP